MLRYSIELLIQDLQLWKIFSNISNHEIYNTCFGIRDFKERIHFKLQLGSALEKILCFCYLHFQLYISIDYSKFACM